MTIRLLHVSDTHLGNRQYGSDVRRDDFAEAFEQAIEYAIDENVDAVIHTGDLFDSRDPSLPDLNRCIDILERLREADIPFYGIVGNHERKMDDQYLDLINKTRTAERLDRNPRLVNGEVALYGIDAVTKPAWHAEDFELEAPPEDAFTHQPIDRAGRNRDPSAQLPGEGTVRWSSSGEVTRIVSPGDTEHRVRRRIW